MKKEILCENCQKSLKKILIDVREKRKKFKEKHPSGIIPFSELDSDDIDHAGPAESAKLISGKSKGEYRCDFCNKNIHFGEYACASTIGIIRNEYTEWESEYIDIRNEENIH